jgi:hypothetical protein
MMHPEICGNGQFWPILIQPTAFEGLKETKKNHRMISGENVQNIYRNLHDNFSFS